MKKNLQVVEKNPFRETSWSFALINRRLAEIYFTIKNGQIHAVAHCYVKKEEFTKKEQKDIENDIKKFCFSYRNKKYKRMI